jgi:hypothetical protein
MNNPNRIQSKYIKQYKSIMSLKPAKSMQGMSMLKYRKRMYELNKIDALLSLMRKKQHSVGNINELLRTHKNPPAFKFYDSVDILLHKKVGDTRDMINEVKIG